MFLHPRDAVLSALDVNHRGFAVVHHFLDVAVQQAAVSWEDCYDDLSEVHGATLASTVRGRVRAMGLRGGLGSSTLKMITVPNCGQHLYDRSGTRYRILERPLSEVFSGRLLPVSEPEVETLFGMIEKLDYELAVLWAVDFKTRSLHKAVLAAVADMDNPKKTVIYAEELLPTPLAVTLASAPSLPEAEEFITEVGDASTPMGYADLFGETEGFGKPS